MDPAKSALPAGGQAQPTQTVLELFESNVRTKPDAVAVRDASGDYTYGQIGARVDQIASKITASSDPVKPNPYVAILLPQGSDFISSLYGIWKSGLGAGPIDIGNSVTQIGFILEELGNPILLTSSQYLTKVHDYSNVILVGEGHEVTYCGQSEVKVIRKATAGDIAFVVFTSGSTGRPKGVLIPHRIVWFNANSAWSLKEVSAKDVSLAYSSPAFILSFSEYVPLLCRGGVVVVPNTDLRTDLDALHKFINEHGITLISMTTQAAVKMIDKPMPSLRWLRFGGEKLTVPIPNNTTFRMIYVYGLSECFAISIRMTFDEPGIPNNGPLVPGVSVVFLDEDLKPVPEGEKGEICVWSPLVFMGYLNNPELTNQRFIPNPNNPDQILFRTGDIGYLTPNKELVVCGRADFQVKIMGNRIELGQVEFALQQHPQIRQAAAIVVENNETKRLVAFCTPVEGETIPDLNTVCDFLEDHLPRFAFPSQINSIDKIPMTTSGKFDRQALKAIKVTKLIEPVQTETETKLAKIWAETLRIPVEEIGRNDTFFSLGGNSLQLALIVTKLQGDPWFLQIQIKQLFKASRLDKFAALVDSLIGQKGAEQTENPDQLTEADFEKDSALGDTFPKEFKEFPTGNENILVTGTTGYVGANFFKTLIDQSSNSQKIYCLIRAKSNADAKARLELTLKKYGIEMPTSEKTLERIVCIAGDISKHQFGMSNSDFSALCTQIDTIFHMAAEVHFLKSYSELRESNVGGTRSLLNFAIQSKLKVLHYISTFSVVGGLISTEEILESRDEIFKIKEAESRDMGYAQSKRIGEKLVWHAIERGFPAVVYRLGEIGAHSNLNIVNKQDFLARLFITCKETGFHPMMDKSFPYGSVDSTCESILEVAKQGQKNSGKCFHIFENQISYLDGFRALKNVVGLERIDWAKKIAGIIQSHSDMTQQQDYSILLQLIQNMGGSSSVLEKKFSNENLKNVVSGAVMSFNPNQNWDRYLSALFDGQN